MYLHKFSQLIIMQTILMRQFQNSILCAASIFTSSQKEDPPFPLESILQALPWSLIHFTRLGRLQADTRYFPIDPLPITMKNNASVLKPFLFLRSHDRIKTSFHNPQVTNLLKQVKPCLYFATPNVSLQLNCVHIGISTGAILSSWFLMTVVSVGLVEAKGWGLNHGNNRLSRD